jgi:hypothetical protein
MSNNKQIVYGLEKYFNFVNDKLKESYIRHLIDLQHHEDVNRPWALKEAIRFDYEHLPKQGRDDRINTYTSICVDCNLNIESTVYLLSNAFPEDSFCIKLAHLQSQGKELLLGSIFSRTQVLSKIWLGETIAKFQNHFNNVLLLGGWTTHHSLFFKDIKVDNLFSIDIDESINETAKIFNPAVVIDNSDVIVAFNRLDRDFDLIINTSAEHMSMDWFNSIKPGTPVLIQSNNMDDPDHINNSIHLGEFLRKYPVSKTYFRGEYNFDNYSRFMVFGVK